MNAMPEPSTLIPFLSASPTAFHAADAIAGILAARGFTLLREEDAWDLDPGRGYFVHRGQAGVAAFRVGSGSPATAGINIAAAHTDSPGLKAKNLSLATKDGITRVGVEVYGSPILSTWFDRELSLAGRALIADGGGVRSALVDLRSPVAVIPNLAIHYNREINKGGFAPDPQNHLSALLALDLAEGEALEAAVARSAGLDPAGVVGADLFFYPAQDPALLGDKLLVSGRLDNLSGCHGILEALTGSPPGEKTAMAFFFEAEEVGSMTSGGAHSCFLGDILTRIVLASGGGQEEVFRAKARSFIISVDAAHGLHPNFPDRHDAGYSPKLGGGPVVKISAAARYATSGPSAARFEALCVRGGVPCQRYIIRSDLPAGSTVGPVSSSFAGVETVDVGIPLWAMHSARETCSPADHAAMIKALAAFYAE